MPSANYAASIVREVFPDAKISLERGALHVRAPMHMHAQHARKILTHARPPVSQGKALGSYNSNPQGKLTVTETNKKVEVASVVQADVTQEQAPGPGLDELKARLAAFATEVAA